MGLRVGPNYQRRINHLDQRLKKLKREKAHKLNIMKIRVIQVQKFFEFQKNVTVEKLGYIKNPVEHKASVLALKNREREREREREAFEKLPLVHPPNSQTPPPSQVIVKLCCDMAFRDVQECQS